MIKTTTDENVKLGVKIYGRSERINDYLNGEFSCFEDCAVDDPRFEEYSAFLNKLYKEDYNHKEIVLSKDLLIFFINDVENRASIDYHEGHYSDDEDITAGGKAMDRLHKRLLKAHNIKHNGFQRHEFIK